MAFTVLHTHRLPVGCQGSMAILSWRISASERRDTSVIPKSVSPERIAANFASSAWELTPEDHDLISSIEDRCRVYPDDWLPAQVFWEEDN
ncbi:hypothetical protein LLEC1_01466 [Akanthomyces lecanii]|uniref:Uncharacterized protein n=1 Tax=Cordyceps confragosa TaxID=2714763 RepID=A0A179I158_CORDF|nr:hypothetical protein LLEC1_01466 [Akanthomyces lecanii]